MYYVYELQYPNGTPFYVGKGKGDRCNKHLKGRDNSNSFKCRIINKIRNSRQEPIIKKVAENLEESVAFYIEKFLIAYYGRRNIGTGILTNLTDGGEGGCSYRSEKTRMKISKSLKGSVGGMKGKYHSNEAKNKIKSSLTGRPCSDETKEKIRIGNLGKKVSEETKRKIGDKNSKAVTQFTKNGEFVAKYNSIRDAERSLGKKNMNITSVCRGKRKSAGGYIWKYT